MVDNPRAGVETSHVATAAKGKPVAAGALVIGGDYRGLGVVRSLGRHGIPVWVLADDHKIAAHSRYCRRSLPWPTASLEQRVPFLVDLCSRHDLTGWALIPTGDESVALVARHHDQLAGHFTLTTPPWQTLRWAHDKRLTHRLAEQLGVEQPWTRYPGSRESVAELECRFPAVLKPAVKESFNSFTHAKAWRVGNRAELLARYDEAAALVGPEMVMVQELIPGGGEAQFSFAALCRDGAPLAWLTARRTRQYPIDFGRASSFVETVDCPEIVQPSRQILARLAYTGLIELEFKRDRRDGGYKLLDLNPRVWGWHGIGRLAGTDFAYLLWQMVRGVELPELCGRPGVRWIRTLTDLPALLAGLRAGQLTLRSYLRSLRGPLEFAVFALDDPLPTLVDAPLLLRLAVDRGAV